MAKSNPLAQGLESLSKPLAPAAASAAPAKAVGGDQAAKPLARASSREGQSLIGGFFAPPVHKQLKMLAAETSMTQQALLAEALNMVFAKYGKPEIAALSRIFKSGNS